MQIIEKTLVLHSKFVYSKIREYYQENNAKQDVVNFCGKEVVVDSYTYAHVGIRHMAEWTKYGRTDKTCHGPEIDIDILPKEIIGFLNHYARYIGCTCFDQRRIYLRYKERNNAIVFEELSRPLKGGEKFYYLRVQSFYPAELREDGQRILQMKLQMINDELGFFIS